MTGAPLASYEYLAEIEVFPEKLSEYLGYADQEAYRDHLKTAHFKKYKEGTADMVKSLKLPRRENSTTYCLDIGRKYSYICTTDNQ